MIQQVSALWNSKLQTSLILQNKHMCFLLGREISWRKLQEVIKESSKTGKGNSFVVVILSD